MNSAQAVAALPQPWPGMLPQATGAGLILERIYLRLWHSHGELRLEHGPAEPGDRHACLGQAGQNRFLLGDDRQPLAIVPRLADRPVVTRPLVPTELLPRQRTTLYLSTPLSLALTLGEQVLRELPSIRLSDSWFGPSPIVGELCYATHTRARLELEAIDDDPFRAVTAVTIANQSDSSLKLDRINIPMPNLALYCDGQRFSTASLTVTRNRDPAMAQVEIDTRPPRYSSAAIPVAQPRNDVRGGVLNRAVDLLFA